MEGNKFLDVQPNDRDLSCAGRYLLHQLEDVEGSLPISPSKLTRKGCLGIMRPCHLCLSPGSRAFPAAAMMCMHIVCAAASFSARSHYDVVIQSGFKHI